MKIDFNERSTAKIEEVAKRLDISIADVVRNALTLYRFVTDPKVVTRKDEIAIFDSETETVKKIILIPGRPE